MTTQANDQDDFNLDSLDVPETEIEYQQDDGNSECEDGACKI